MTRIAAFYDVHGNLPALEAVLAEVQREGVDQVVVGGDVVPGPMAAECLSLFQDLPWPVHYILGNGEVDTLGLHRGEPLVRVPPQFHDTMSWVLDKLSSEQVDELASWPRVHNMRVPGLGEVMFCHATPRDDNEIFTQITPEDRLRPIFEATGADVVICGHTHMQFERSVGGVQVLNAGSVGMPFGESGAYWALIGPEGVALRCTKYDLRAATNLLETTGYPTDLNLEQPPSASDMLALFEGAALR